MSIGAVFTPEPLARELFAGLPQAAAADEPLTLLDPACGAGGLLAAALAVARGRGRRGPVRLLGLEIERDVAARARAELGRIAGRDRALEVDVRCVDALDPRVRWPAGAQLVANPPWASLSGRRAVALPATTLRHYREAWPSLGDWPSLHGAFLERIARYCRQNRVGARVLAPAPVCSLEGYGPLREAVTAHAELSIPPAELGEGAFEGISEPAVILTLRGRRRRVAGRRDVWIRARPEVAGLLHRLGSFPRLPAEALADPGVHTGNSAALLVVRDGAATWPGLREGRDLAPFRLSPPRLGLRTDLRPGDGQRFRYGPLESYRRVAVLVRQTADRPLAALHRDATYFRNSLLACTPQPELDPAFCVAILNGPVAAAWHRLSFADARQRAFPQVKVSHLRSLPFPITRRAEDPRLHDRLAKAARRAEEAQAGREGKARAVAEASLEAYGLEADERELVRVAAGIGPSRP